MTPQDKHTFHPRVINNINIPFSNSEMTLLQKGLKYNLHTNKKKWIQNLGTEAETTIIQLPTNEQEVYRKLVADHTDKLRWQYNSNPTHNTRPEARLIKSIQTKLQNNAMITRADKGNSIAILTTQ